MADLRACRASLSSLCLKALTLRVMDFYRCAGGKIMENWVLLDYLDLFDQMGVDLLDRAAEME